MSLLQLRHYWSREAARVLKAHPGLTDQEVAKEIGVRKDDMDDFLRFMKEKRDGV